MIWALAAQFLRGPAGRYEQMIEAVAWGRWEEVLRRVDSVGGQVSPDEVAFRKAQALAGLGRLDEALNVVEPFSDGEAMPEWLYLSRLPEVYLAANRRDIAIELTEQARIWPRTIRPCSSSWPAWRPLSTRSEACPNLAGAGPFACPQRHAPPLHHVHRRPDPPGGGPGSRGPATPGAIVPGGLGLPARVVAGRLPLDLMHAALALASAELGDIEAPATTLARQAKARGLKVDDLIGRCERAIGHT